MNRLRQRLDAIAEKAPDVPDRTWDRAWKKASQSASSSPLAAKHERPRESEL
jgi:hypothetical protein